MEEWRRGPGGEVQEEGPYEVRGRQQKGHEEGALGVRELEVGIYSKCGKTKKKGKILNEARGGKAILFIEEQI